MKKITIIYPVYLSGSTKIIDKTLSFYNSFSESTKSSLKVVLVDDCSPILFSLPKELNLDVSLLRISTNIKWNQGGARNLGALYSDTEFVLVTDLDHVFEEDTIINLLNSNLPEKSYIKFNRMRYGKKIKSHPNTFFMKKYDFISIGCVDEDFCGRYGYEDILFHRKMNLMGYNEHHEDVKTHVDYFNLSSNEDSYHNLKRTSFLNKVLLYFKLKGDLRVNNVRALRFRFFLKEKSNFKSS